MESSSSRKTPDPLWQVELVRTVTSDGMRLDGALFEPPGGDPSKLALDAVLCLHGVAANFYTSSTLEGIVPTLRELGLAVLLVNTRGHDAIHTAVVSQGRRRQGAALEIVDECRRDVAAWCRFFAERGLSRVVLLGHSLGAVKAIYAQAHEPQTNVSGVVAISAPRLSYRAFVNSLESAPFVESMSTAQELVGQKRGEELFTARFPFPMLISAASYVDKYGPTERYNFQRFADKITCPSLFTYGSKELETGGIAFAGLPDALAKLAQRGPREVAIVPGADHLYTETAAELGKVIGQWLLRTFSAGAQS